MPFQNEKAYNPTSECARFFLTVFFVFDVKPTCNFLLSSTDMTLDIDCINVLFIKRRETNVIVSHVTF